MAERLYGVDHGAEHPLTGEEIDVQYSSGLRQELISLPPGTTIGIEYAKELGAERTDGIFFRAIGYWQALEGLCEDLGLQVIYLDDFESCERALELLKEQQRLVNSKKDDDDPQKIRELREALFKAETEGRYVREVVREDKIIENILRFQPQEVIVGQAHGDVIMSNLGELSQKGLTVEAYFHENLDPLYISRTILEPGIPDPIHSREREALIRQYRAVTLGRVLSDSKLKPDFIGTWNPGCRPQGLFEMYVKERSGTEFSGIIEDTAGTASFRGTIMDDFMEITKTYDPKKSFEGFEGPILYVGLLERGIFVGNFQAEREIYPGMKPHPFYVNTGDRLQDCEID